MPMPNAFGASTPGASALGLGSLGQQASQETDEERKKRLEQERQTRLMGGTAGASALGLGTAAGGGIGLGF